MTPILTRAEVEALDLLCDYVHAQPDRDVALDDAILMMDALVTRLWGDDRPDPADADVEAAVATVVLHA